MYLKVAGQIFETRRSRGPVVYRAYCRLITAGRRVATRSSRTKLHLSCNKSHSALNRNFENVTGDVTNVVLIVVLYVG